MTNDRDDDYVSFQDWKADLEQIAGGTIEDMDGWGACYGAGLTPVETMACFTNGEHSQRVMDYWELQSPLTFSKIITH